MGKRSDFKRRKNDFYSTFDPRAVAALLPHLEPGTRFIEPCAGDGILARQLIAAGHVCMAASDIEPQADGVRAPDGAVFITNPPWTRQLLHRIIAHLSDQAPTWLLFDADWMHTQQAAPFMPRCRRIVSVGRLKWIPDSTMDGKDNCAWYLFGKPGNAAPEFHGRAANDNRRTK